MCFSSPASSFTTAPAGAASTAAASSFTRWTWFTFSPPCFSPSATTSGHRTSSHRSLSQILVLGTPKSTIGVHVFVFCLQTFKSPYNSCTRRCVICYYKSPRWLPIGLIVGPICVSGVRKSCDRRCFAIVIVCWRGSVSSSPQVPIKFLSNVTNTFIEFFSINYFCDRLIMTEYSMEYYI